MMLDRWREASNTVIKFKIPKLEAAAMDPSSRIRVCLECNKEFSSGKALGGHMRVHVNKNPKFLKPAKAFNNNNLKPYYMNSVNNEGKPTCSQCGKTFPSMKSLFGHMRCHPERLWRGILPPPTTPTTAAARRRNDSASGSDDDGGDDVVDLTKFLLGWPVTERRGRKSLKLAEDNDVVLLEAVEDLLSLANAGDSVTESGVTNRQLKAEVDDDEMMKNIITVNSAYKIKRRKKMKLMMELEPEPNAGGSPPLAPLTEHQQQQTVTDQCKYKCTTCNKGFATHQALGGHRSRPSSHNKSRLISIDHQQIEEHDYQTFVMNQSGDNNMEKEIEFAGGHQCKICDKGFETRQAFGGHKRCHWGGGITEAQGQSSQITSAGEAGSQTGSDRRILDFDLNEVPPVMMMEEDEYANVNVNGNGNGYASTSSYNSNMG